MLSRHSRVVPLIAKGGGRTCFPHPCHHMAADGEISSAVLMPWELDHLYSAQMEWALVCCPGEVPFPGKVIFPDCGDELCSNQWVAGASNPGPMKDRDGSAQHGSNDPLVLTRPIDIIKGTSSSRTVDPDMALGSSSDTDITAAPGAAQTSQICIDWVEAWPFNTNMLSGGWPDPWHLQSRQGSQGTIDTTPYEELCI